MRCDVCKKALTGSYRTDLLFGDVACPPCAETSQCMWCGRLRPSKKHFGYNSCDSCRGSAVNTLVDLNRLRDATLPLIFEHFGPVSYGDLPIRFGVVPAPEYGILKPLGLAFYGSADSHIRLQEGMPFEYAVGVLAHEYGHMLANLEPDSLRMRPRATMHDRVTEEGFCEVLCALGLLRSSSDAARFQSFLMPGNPDPVYGDGFRMMWSRLDEVGSAAALLETLTLQEHHFKKPLGESKVDDFEVPDDISPLVELASGDRDKGPLRGTAILTKDLPDDAPRGPRLRGRGLGVLDRPATTSTPAVTKGTLRGAGLNAEPDIPKSPDVPKGTLRGKGLGRKK